VEEGMKVKGSVVKGAPEAEEHRVSLHLTL